MTTMTRTTDSARIGAFEKAAIEDAAKAVDALKADLTKAGGPLVEPIHGDEENVLVTFVWIGADGPVSLQSQIVLGASRSTPLTRVHGTDVWHLSVPVRADVSTTYQFVIDDPSLNLDPAELIANPKEMMRLREEATSRTFADPFNPERLPMGLEPKERWFSVITLPAAEPLPWFDEPANPGTLESHQLASKALGTERKVTIYTPPGYSEDGEAYPLVVMLDGEMWTNAARQHVAFDNLIAAGRIPPVVVVFVDCAPSDWPQGMLRAYEMNCNPDFPTMLADELLPWLRERRHVTTDPSRVVIAGVSFGGVASSWIGFSRPEVFGNVLACSPAVWWTWATETERYTFDSNGRPEWFTGREQEPEWLPRHYAANERRPLRFWVDVGCLEVGLMPRAGVDYRASVRHFRTVLIAKGYDVTYYESAGGHDWPTFRRCYVKGLETLLTSGGRA